MFCFHGLQLTYSYAMQAHRWIRSQISIRKTKSFVHPKITVCTLRLPYGFMGDSSR